MKFYYSLWFKLTVVIGILAFFIASLFGILASSMEEMAIGARKINETGEALRGIAHQMDDSIKDIGSQIDLFKV